MDPKQWPDEIHAAVEKVHCPRCGRPREQLMITVRYTAPTWTIYSNCLAGCKHIQWWQLLRQGLVPKPPEEESIPLPEWVKSL